MSLFARWKTLTVLVLSGLSLYFGLLSLLDRVNWRRATDGMEWVQTDEGVQLRSFTGPRLITTDQTPAKGDRLVEMQGLEVRSLDDYIDVLELLAQDPASPTRAEYVLARGRERFSVPVEIRMEPVATFTDFLLALVAFAHLGIGLVVFLRNWKAQGAFHFFLICLFAFIACLYRYSGRADLFDLFIYWCSATVFLMLPPLFLHFCCFFPQPLALMRRAPWMKPALYLPGASLLAIHVFWFSGALRDLGLPRTTVLQNLFDRVHLTHFVAAFLLGTVALAFTRRQAESEVQRLQMRWVMRGSLIGVLPFTFLYAVPFVLGIEISALMETSILSLVLIPLAFGYAVSKHRLMDVELIFKQGATYVLASSALLGLYVGMVLLIGRVIQGFAPEAGFMLFALSALLVAFLFAPLRARIQNQINRYFYRDAYDYRRSLAEFGRTLGSEIRLSLLLERVLHRIHKTLAADPVAVFLREEPHAESYRLYQLLDSGETRGFGKVLDIPDAIFSDFDRELNPLFLLPPSEAVERVRRQLAELQLHYVQPLAVHGRLIGFVALGRRHKTDLLSSEDLDLMSTLAGYAAIAIDNALLYRSLETKANELAQMKVYNENVVESITVGVLVITPEGRITVWNNSLRDICGTGRSQALGRNISEIFPEDLITTMRNVVPGPRWTVQETAHLYKTPLEFEDDHPRLVNMTFAPFVLQEDVITGTLIVIDDITEKVQLEVQLTQAEKLSSIGLFAAGIAHEVNTPLAGISSYVQMLLKNAKPGDETYETLKKIESQSFRASDIVNSLLNFAQVRETDVQEININTLMLATLSLLNHQLKKGRIELNLELDPSLPTTMASSGKLQQVFMNLFLNARDAMPRGGQLTVRTTHEESVLQIEVEDTGIGISDQDLTRIYDPFFTTKDVGRGTGLGLSVSYGIIKEHSGHISVKSRPGEGTVFCLHLPVRHIN